jgi:hypothetical protein
MTVFIVILLFLLTMVALLSARRIVALPVAVRFRAVLLSLRLALVALLMVAFFEPVIMLERLPKAQRVVPVLIDVSKSMRSFSPDSVIAPLLSALQRWNSLSGKDKQRFVFFRFGDSLHSMRHDDPLVWSDRRSYFPETWSDTKAQTSNGMIIISDGNWSNASNPAPFFADKNAWYVPLKPSREFPWLRIEMPDFPSESVVDSPLIATATIEGMATKTGALVVSAIEQKRISVTTTINVAAGYFKRVVKLRLPDRSAGPHLYRFDAKALSDTLSTSRYALHTAIPTRFTYAIADAGPSLDKRFIRLALQRRIDFREEATPKPGSLDLLVIFNWNGPAQKMIGALKPRGAVLFIGCAPCSLAVITPRNPVRYLRGHNRAGPDPWSDLTLPALPPLSRLASCKHTSARPTGAMLRALIQKTSGNGFDTLDLVYTGRFAARPSIVCTVLDEWQWDFLPLAVQTDEERIFSFSDRLLTFTKAIITAGLSDKLLVYPAARLTAMDSLSFCAAFPAGLPVPSPVRLTCTFTGERDRSFDTSFVMKVTGGIHEGFRCRPLDPGGYRLEVTAVAGKERFAFADSVRVDDDQSEQVISGQNAPMLAEIAQPLDDFSDTSLRERFFGRNDGAGAPVKETFHFNRTWPLLILIFIVLGAEWLLRRALKLD